MQRTDSIVCMALGYVPQYLNIETPPIHFRVGKHLAELGCQEVGQEDRGIITDQIVWAFEWCRTRFPLSRKSKQSSWISTITQIEVGHSIHRGEILSASSAQAPGNILFAADWPLESCYRIGSLIAHESMHQALYVRETEEEIATPHSLSYSPWKNSLRPGRLIWHSYWTFACQFTMLAESLLREKEMLIHDPGLLAFLADMQARIAACLGCAKDFGAFPHAETSRCELAMAEVEQLGLQLAVLADYEYEIARATDHVFSELERWSSDLLERRPLAG